MKRIRCFPYECEFVYDLIYFNILQGREFICDGDSREVFATYNGDEQCLD